MASRLLLALLCWAELALGSFHENYLKQYQLLTSVHFNITATGLVLSLPIDNKLEIFE